MQPRECLYQTTNQWSYSTASIRNEEVSISDGANSRITTDDSNPIRQLTDIGYRETSVLGLDQEFIKDYVPDDYKLDLYPFTSRYFFVTSFDWTTSQVRGSVIPAIRYVPRDIILSNTSLQYALRAAAMYRSKLVLSISIGGTIVHSGCLLVAALPPVDEEFLTLRTNVVNTCMTSPHAFLYANEATSVELAFPWYCNTDYATTAVADASGVTDYVYPNNNFGCLLFYIMNPLSAGGGSNSLQVTVLAKFEELELKVPTPRFVEWRSESIIGDVAKGVTFLTRTGKKVTNAIGDIFDNVSRIASWFTGLHNPNRPIIDARLLSTIRNFTNVVDGEQRFEKLDPYVSVERVTNEFIFGTKNDEMNMRYVLSKEQFLGTCAIRDSDPVGTLLWSRPISPWQVAADTFSNNIALMYYMSRAWNGDMQLVIRSSCSNKQQFKIMICRYYQIPLDAISSYPAMPSIVNTLSQVVEFSAGGQEHVIDLPYLSRLEVTPCTRDSLSQSFLHGQYYVYVSQKLTIGDNSPTTAELNIFLRSKDLNFYGYATETPVLYTPLEFRSEGLEAMNKPQRQETDTVNLELENLSTRIHPIVSLRDYFRRMYRAGSITWNATASRSQINIELASLLSTTTPAISFSEYVFTPIHLLSAMYYGRQLGFKIRVNIKVQEVIDTNLLRPRNIKAYYLPPNCYVNRIDADAVVAACAPTGVFSSLVPLPVIDGPQSMTSTGIVQTMEFVVPNVSFYKFLSTVIHGGPFPVGDNRSITDYGNIILTSDDLAENVAYALELYVGLTDESRLGFHNVAPFVQYTDGVDKVYSKYGDFLGGRFPYSTPGYLRYTRNP